MRSRPRRAVEPARWPESPRRTERCPGHVCSRGKVGPRVAAGEGLEALRVHVAPRSSRTCESLSRSIVDDRRIHVNIATLPPSRVDSSRRGFPVIRPAGDPWPGNPAVSGVWSSPTRLLVTDPRSTPVGEGSGIQSNVHHMDVWQEGPWRLQPGPAARSRRGDGSGCDRGVPRHPFRRIRRRRHRQAPLRRPTRPGRCHLPSRRDRAHRARVRGTHPQPRDASCQGRRSDRSRGRWPSPRPRPYPEISGRMCRSRVVPRPRPVHSGTPTPNVGRRRDPRSVPAHRCTWTRTSP